MTKAKTIEAEMPLGIGHVQLIRSSWDRPIDVLGISRFHHLELSLLPRSREARACFPDLWGPHRFEPIGEVFLLPASTRVRATSQCPQQNSIVCAFDPAAVSPWLAADMDWTDGRLRGTLNIVNTSIRSLLFRIGEELRNPGFGSETLLDLMARQVAVELSRHLSGIGESKAIGGLSARHLRLIDQRLAQVGPPPSLTELTELCNLSLRHLTRAYRASRGRSIGDQIAESRMDQARQLLAAGECVKAVAYSTGFTAPSNFSAAFLRATGETPRQYRYRVSCGGSKASVLAH